MVTNTHPICPQYIPPTVVYLRGVIYETYEGSAMCKLTDKWCLREYGQECDWYNDWLKEKDNELET